MEPATRVHNLTAEGMEFTITETLRASTVEKWLHAVTWTASSPTTAELLIAARLLVTGKNRPVTVTIISDGQIYDRHCYKTPLTDIINVRH
jgi:hypothetical protein